MDATASQVQIGSAVLFSTVRNNDRQSLANEEPLAKRCDSKRSHPMTLTTESGPVFCFGPFRFDAASGLLARGGEEAVLPSRAAAVLTMLLGQPGQLVTKKDLLSTVWEDALVTESSLTDVISSLRQALDDDPREPRFIQTIHGRGYRFVGELVADDEEAGGPALAQERSPGESRRGWARLAPWLVSLFFGALALATFLTPTEPQGVSPQTKRLSLLLEPDQPLAWGGRRIAISPDGTRIAYIAEIDDEARLVVRGLDERQGRAIAGSEGSENPFFSPEGRQVAFFRRDKDRTLLMTVPVDGGPAHPVCEVDSRGGGSWGDDGNIVYGSRRGLMRVASSGGRPERLTTIDRGRGETGHLWPSVLPGASSVVYMSVRGEAGSALVARSLAAGKVVELSAQALDSEFVTAPQYLPSGHLLFLGASGRGIETLRVAPFDPDTFELLGSSRPVTEPKMSLTNFAVSAEGTLIYGLGPLAREAAQRQMVWVDRDGNEMPVRDFQADLRTLRLSPDGSRIAAEVFAGRRSEIWIFGLLDDTIDKVTSHGYAHAPLWSPDGSMLFYGRSEAGRVTGEGSVDLYSRPSDFSRDAELRLRRTGSLFPTSWTAAGELVLHEMHSGNQRQILVLALDGERQARPLLATEARLDERSAMISPDGRWVAYVSDESGRDEVYLRPFPGPGGRRAISNNGGAEPLWAPSAQELFYREGDRMVAVGLVLGPTPRVAARQVLFKAPYFYFGIRTVYDYDPRTGRFLMARTPTRPDGRHRLEIVLNWFAELSSADSRS